MCPVSGVVDDEIDLSLTSRVMKMLSAWLCLMGSTHAVKTQNWPNDSIEAFKAFANGFSARSESLPAMPFHLERKSVDGAPRPLTRAYEAQG